jgi:asparagine synthase (glutamine-hydrolysing)
MCGIAGEIAFGHRPDSVAVDRMAATMASRGPDGDGSWTRGATALAHRRLKIIDLSETGAQPMVDSDLGLTVVFNGCIYNYRELRQELERDGYAFFSQSDTEVLLKGYSHWGEAFVERLYGMFAFAIAEHASGDLLLARDRLGIKPLYLTDSPERLRFASTLPALLAGGGVDTSIDPDALHHYLSFHSVVPAPRTILRGVRKLTPATTLRISATGERRERVYWQARFARDPDRAGMDASEWEDALLSALRRAVERRMVADVPVGVLLSGGIDSSLIVALLAEAGQTGLATFSVGFEDVGEHEGDEFRYSDLVARRFDTNHTQIRVPAERMTAALEQAILAMSEPMTSHDVVGFHLLSEEVHRHVTVVQSGQGADEILAGYDWYPPLQDAPGDGFDTYARSFFDRDHAEIAAAVSPDYMASTDMSRRFARERFARPGAGEPVDRALRLDTEVMLVDDPVKRVDNMTMAWGLECRVPFLDHELVELAAACPPELKLGHGGKGVLKDASRRLLPSEVIDRPKGYFPVPALIELQGRNLESVREALTNPAARARGLFRRAYVEELLAHPNERRTPLGVNKLWQLGLLELWLQAHGIE